MEHRSETSSSERPVARRTPPRSGRSTRGGRLTCQWPGRGPRVRGAGPQAAFDNERSVSTTSPSPTDHQALRRRELRPARATDPVRVAAAPLPTTTASIASPVDDQPVGTPPVRSQARMTVGDARHDRVARQHPVVGRRGASTGGPDRVAPGTIGPVVEVAAARTMVVDRSEDAMFTSLIVALDLDHDVGRTLDVVEALVLRTSVAVDLVSVCDPARSGSDAVVRLSGGRKRASLALATWSDGAPRCRHPRGAAQPRRASPRLAPGGGDGSAPGERDVDRAQHGP